MIGVLQVFLLYIWFSGAVFDALAPRLLVPGSGIVAVFSIFMLSITKPQKIWDQYLCQGVLFNVGATFGFFPWLAINTHWFRRKNAYTTGCVATGASIGGIIIPIMMHRLLPKVGFVHNPTKDALNTVDHALKPPSVRLKPVLHRR
ncbi:uncharacterized protein BT62DRAFT_932611 [Guyanagaster necrorhizus]|uniref:Uncharacterized protein n=1 Tax=Guyanagaster necrorhizus TaxID=856835 RepID=A0A9P8ARL7_9AGAR|nr:uncharacterized protein BT62DRAFT_932611 [Guyanagaster necrorhizus MCA 3950]KAG7445518.1 hypothetical protein BT62DRAFT_932611 [Guyanagaster necrorhizus MCA 3950]